MRRYVLILIALSLVMVTVSALEIEISNPGKTTNRIFNLEPLVLIINTFLDLLDTPSSYSGSNGFCVTVNSGGTGLAFTNCTVATSGNPTNVTLQQAYDSGQNVDVNNGDLTFNLTNNNIVFKSANKKISFKKTGASQDILLIDPGNDDVIFDAAFIALNNDSGFTSTDSNDLSRWSLFSNGFVVEGDQDNPFQILVTKKGVFDIVLQRPLTNQFINFTISKWIFNPSSGVPRQQSILEIASSVDGFGNDIRVLESAGWVPLEDQAFDLGAPTRRWNDLYLAGNILGQSGSPPAVNISGSTGDARFGHDGFNITNNGTIVVSSGNITAGDWFLGKLNFSDVQNHPDFLTNATVQALSLNQTEADKIYLNLSGTNANQHINLGIYNLTMPKVSLDEVAFPNASIKAIVTNDLVNGTAYGVYMDGQTGTNKPTFWIQPGGPGQASGIARSFLIVNEMDDLQDTTNITSCSAWADAAGEILQIDCNTTASGADLIVGDDTQVFGDMWLKDSDGEWHFLTRELSIIDELLSNTISNIVDVFISGDDLLINDTTGESFTVTIGRNFTILTQSNDSVGLNVGTDLDPQFNYISYKNAANPTLTADTSEPSEDNAHVASALIGSSGANVYGLIDRFSHDDKFVAGVYHRFFDMGALYNTGFLPALNTTRINITSGTFDVMLDEYATTLIRDSASDGFFFVNSSGQFIQTSDLSSITHYSDGTLIGNNKMVNVIWGIVPINFTEVRIMAIIQDFPGAGKEYVNVDLAESDRFNKVNIFPSDDFLKKIFVPIARTVFKSNSYEFQTLTNGEFFLDLRGTSGGLGGSAPSPSITVHGDLDGLTEDDHPQYILTNGSRLLTDNWDAGIFNITAGGFFGLFNWIVGVGTQYLTFNGTTLDLDVTKLNIDFNQTEVINSVNTTTNIESLGFATGAHTVDTNATTECGNNEFLDGDGDCIINNFLIILTNIFDQSLNSTDNVTFARINVTTGLNMGPGANITHTNSSRDFYGSENQAEIYWDAANSRLVIRVS